MAIEKTIDGYQVKTGDSVWVIKPSASGMKIAARVTLSDSTVPPIYFFHGNCQAECDHLNKMDTRFTMPPIF
jgi:hypothetical protein